jgi:hypothetical protein
MTYKALLGYAYSIDKHNFKDLAHETLLTHLEKGRNLLEPNFNKAYVYVALKRMYYTIARGNKYITYTKKGVDTHVTLQMCDVDPEMLFTQPNIYNVLKLQEIENHVHNMARTTYSPDLYIRVLRLHTLGYNDQEIAYRVNSTSNGIRDRKKKIKSWIKEWSI